jgi:hypothetical protein
VDEEELESSALEEAQWLWSAPGDWQPYAVLRGTLLPSRLEALGGDPTPKNVVRFASRYGWLVQQRPFWASLHAGRASQVMHGEPVSLWAMEARRFHDLRETWRAAEAVRLARSADFRSLRDERLLVRKLSLSQGSEKPMLRYRSSATARGSASPSETEILLLEPVAGVLRRDGVVAQARFVVCHLINERLEGHVSPVLMPLSGGEMVASADQVFVPDSLLAAAYWLFADEVSAASRHPVGRMCINPDCGRRFRGRPNQKACSESCGARYRHLKRTGRLR